MSLENLESYNFEKWQEVAGTAKERIETRLFLDGDFVDAAEGGRFATIDPASGETIAEM